ncbi:S41 family peptidase [Devosia sp. ZB163]|uniref:S41 family peptidase n=1 Tax=Devosia sp. ZB163 TaxID=3025938 RepID=UPI00235FC376|nr:S41 family peptidase [Devosia sp. ZB163]MDC9824408.1 S41 family peptidase [Devosia sp. ZB163]
MTAPSDGDTPSIKQRAAIAARLRLAIEGSFAHWEAVPELDFESAFDAYLEEALRAETRLGFVLASQRLVAQLRNGHTGFHDDRVMRRHGRSFGLMLRPLGEAWTVTISRHAELTLGSVVETIDGAPVAETFARARRFLAASSDRAAADSLFFRRHLLPDALTLGLEGGATFTVAKGEWPVVEVPLPAVRYGERGVAVLAIASFDGPRFEAAAVGAVRTLDRDAPLVIDLRGNGGGNTPLQLLAALMDRPYRRWRSTVLSTTTLQRALGEKPEPVIYQAPRHEPVAGAHRGRLALVIDATVGSAAEDFVMPFKDNGRAVLVGDTTAGSSGQPHRLDLGDRMLAWVGAKRECFPDGSTFEGVGIAPDIRVITTPEDLACGRDPALAAALEAVR